MYLDDRVYIELIIFFYFFMICCGGNLSLYNIWIREKCL